MNTGYTPQQVASAVNGQLVQAAATDIRYLITDSRKVIYPDQSVFFALKGERHDGHRYINQVAQQGVKHFVIAEDAQLDSFPKDTSIIKVADTLEALQALSSYHRQQFDIPVIGITGSNGKTIVKEWLYQLLRQQFHIVRSPKSYNSQVGVPLSVWGLNSEHTLGIFEAGISLPDEMPQLEPIIKPTIGIFTNIGSAHSEGFESETQKIEEKLQLFQHSKVLIYCTDHQAINTAVKTFCKKHPQLTAFSWSKHSGADLEVTKINRDTHHTDLSVTSGTQGWQVRIPFTDEASIENALHCMTLTAYLNLWSTTLASNFAELSPIEMRLQLRQGIYNTSIINDSYNSDLNSLEIALDFLTQQKQHPKKTVILSDLMQTGQAAESLYSQVAQLLQEKQVDQLIGIGPNLSQSQQLFSSSSVFFTSTEEFLDTYHLGQLQDHSVLIKGARAFAFEKISKKLEQQAHETVLDIHLGAMVSNLNYFRSLLKPQTKLMAMVKAHSYGSGSFEVASLLQFHQVDYLAVAYADEGVALRQGGIHLPIMVMNPDINSLDSIVEFDLQPEVYSFNILKALAATVKHASLSNPLGIHLELDTGMHRLGFEATDLPELIALLQDSPELQVVSIFSHFSASDEEEHDSFTREQIAHFDETSQALMDQLNYPVLRHLSNTSGILRFPEAQFDMVRLGIGLYGVDPTGKTNQSLTQVARLKTIISQIKHLSPSERVGYSRKGELQQETTIAIVAIGYADGLDRSLSNGKGAMLVNGYLAPIIGNICMDMTMLDITNIPAEEGEEVIVFGPELSVQELATNAGTIPYEILTNVSQRVKRVYWQE